MLHAIIMAGGSGTRFWPASRADKPKQLLDLLGDRTMIQATVDRLGDLVPADRVLVVTSRRLKPVIQQQLPQLSPEVVIGEPCQRDTAPCIGLAAAMLDLRDKNSTMVVMPADHVIRPDSAFRNSISRAARLVEENSQRLVTFGVTPTYAAESFGYIERGSPLKQDPDAGSPAYAVRKFHEKPAADLARRYLESGDFYWNSGIFVWKARAILDALARFEPAMHQRLQTIAASMGQEDFADVLDREFSLIERKSIDYAVMERFEDVVVIQAPYEWDDLGGWQALARMRGCDAQGNTVVGRHLGLRTEGSIIRTDDRHLVVTLGVKDCIVVHTPDATLVADKHDEESIRKIVELLREQKWEEYL